MTNSDELITEQPKSKRRYVKRTSPYLMDPQEYGDTAGISYRSVCKMLKRGEIPFAVKIAGKWRINRAEAMKSLGLEADAPGEV